MFCVGSGFALLVRFHLVLLYPMAAVVHLMRLIVEFAHQLQHRIIVAKTEGRYAVALLSFNLESASCRFLIKQKKLFQS